MGGFGSAIGRIPCEMCPERGVPDPPSLFSVSLPNLPNLHNLCVEMPVCWRSVRPPRSRFPSRSSRLRVQPLHGLRRFAFEPLHGLRRFAFEPLHGLRVFEFTSAFCLSLSPSEHSASSAFLLHAPPPPVRPRFPPHTLNQSPSRRYHHPHRQPIATRNSPT